MLSILVEKKGQNLTSEPWTTHTLPSFLQRLDTYYLICSNNKITICCHMSTENRHHLSNIRHLYNVNSSRFVALTKVIPTRQHNFWVCDFLQRSQMATFLISIISQWWLNNKRISFVQSLHTLDAKQKITLLSCKKKYLFHISMNVVPVPCG